MSTNSTYDPYSQVTTKIIAAMEKGIIPWNQPWIGLENAVSHKPYRGINVLLLGLTEYKDPRWLTYKQATDLKGNVKKGEKGTQIYFWKFIKKDDGTPKGYTFPLLKSYTVFNVEQCENLKIKSLEEIQQEVGNNITADAVVASMPLCPEIKYGGPRAYYSPVADHVQMPPTSTFKSQEGYYSVLFHELAHSTGHVTRLNRKEVAACQVIFGSCDYSKEELVAQMTSAFIMSTLGLANQDTEKNDVAYLQSWIKKFKDDPKMILTAAGAAQKAADYILNRQEPVVEEGSDSK